jgi:hypothetical protein
MAHSAWAPATRNRFPSSATVRTDARLFDGVGGRPLRLALDDVYRAFASVRLDPTFEVCPHCFTDADRRYLIDTPLLDLTWSDIASILGKAVTTLGSARDFGYFLPRVLEGFALGVHYMPHVLTTKIRLSREAGWSAAQIAAVADFVNALEVIVYAMSGGDPKFDVCDEFVAALRNRIG